MSKEVKTNAEFLFNNQKEYKKRAEENRKIFEEANLPSVLEEVVMDNSFDGRILYRRWDEDHDFSKIFIVEDFFSSGITSIPCCDVDKIKKNGKTIFEALILEDKIFVKDDNKITPLPKGSKEELKDFVLKKINDKEEEKQKPKRFSLIKLFS